MQLHLLKIQQAQQVQQLKSNIVGTYPVYDG